MSTAQRNVLGEPLDLCSRDPLTGFYRSGCCETGSEDVGEHTVCVQVTAEFLEFSRTHGNDLTTPVPAAAFPGLLPGDRWCVCAGRWLEAHRAGVAPRVVLAATHESLLDFIPLAELKRYAIDLV
jgi:uncharacterized protein (DUF2237 family)